MYLLILLPTAPSNALGGFVGCCLGTRRMSHNEETRDQINTGNKFECLISFLRMNWRRRVDLHDGHDHWRERLHRYLYDENGTYTTESYRTVGGVRSARNVILSPPQSDDNRPLVGGPKQIGDAF